MVQKKPIVYAFIDKNQPTRSVETLGRAGKSSRSSGRYETLGLPKHGDDLTVAKKAKKVNRRKQQ